MKQRNSGVQSKSRNQEITIIREFDAPREKVFHALADPEISAAWELSACSFPMRENQERCNFSYPWIKSSTPQESAASKRVVHTLEQAVSPGKDPGALEMIVFEEIVPEKTTVTMVFQCESIDIRGGWTESGMSDCLIASFIKMDELLKKI